MLSGRYGHILSFPSKYHKPKDGRSGSISALRRRRTGETVWSALFGDISCMRFISVWRCYERGKTATHGMLDENIHPP